MLVNVNNSAELFKRDVLVSILIRQFENSVRQEWVRPLTKKAEKYSKLQFVHELGFLNFTHVLLRNVIHGVVQMQTR